MTRRRVVITGMGAVTPLGLSVEETWAGIVAGRSGIDRITLFDPSEHSTQFAGEVKGFDPQRWLEPKEARRLDRFVQFAIAAGMMAVADAGLEITAANRERVGVLIGTGIGGIQTLEETLFTAFQKGIGRISPFFIPMMIGDMASGMLSIRLGAAGPNSCVVTACATGTHALGDAAEIIRRGAADVMIAGGTEAAVTPMGVGGFAAMRALSTRNDAPQRASRPFDAERDGFVMGEGAGVMILEAEEVARARGARILAELAGYGMSGDAYHITQPAPEGEGAVRSMRLALADAGLTPADVDYINAHGTSTPQNDRTETIAVKRALGERAYHVPMSSTKSMTGHLLGAAGAVEAIFCVLALRDGILPPTINYEHPDPECDLDYVPNEARRAAIRVAMSNSFGFGGHNATLVFKTYP